MAVYNTTNQVKNGLENNLSNARTTLESRRGLWQKLPPEKREEWKKSCPDPVISEAWKMYQHLKEFFGE